MPGPFGEILKGAHFDFPSDIGGHPKSVEAACRPGELKAGRGVRVQHVVYGAVFGSDDDLYVAYHVVRPGEGGSALD